MQPGFRSRFIISTISLKTLYFLRHSQTIQQQQILKLKSYIYHCTNNKHTSYPTYGSHLKQRISSQITTAIIALLSVLRGGFDETVERDYCLGLFFYTLFDGMEFWRGTRHLYETMATG